MISTQIMTPESNAKGAVMEITPDHITWKGVWKGGRRRPRKSTTHRKEDISLGDTSYESATGGSNKRFIEPEYDEVSVVLRVNLVGQSMTV